MAKQKPRRIKTNSKPFFRVKGYMKSPSPTRKYYKGKPPQIGADQFMRGEEEYHEKSLPPELAALCRPRV